MGDIINRGLEVEIADHFVTIGSDMPLNNTHCVQLLANYEEDALYQPIYNFIRSDLASVRKILTGSQGPPSITNKTPVINTSLVYYHMAGLLQ